MTVFDVVFLVVFVLVVVFVWFVEVLLCLGVECEETEGLWLLVMLSVLFRIEAAV